MHYLKRFINVYKNIKYYSSNSSFVGDYVLPNGSECVFGIRHVHLNEKYWPDPYKFDPDRFLSENVATRHPCAYLPFSFGPRNCIGKIIVILVI